MKVTMPKEITELSARIAEAHSEIHITRQNIARAEQAVKQAEGITAEIEDLSRKRAEQKALAFVSGKPADLAELNRQMEGLERANRSALEDGTAASLAVTMLTEKLAQQEDAISEMERARHTQALEWLTSVREKAIDRYIKALNDLGVVLAEAVAADRARDALGVRGESTARYLVKALNTMEALPVPHARLIERQGMPAGIVVMDKPIAWLRDDTLGDREHAQLIAELLSAGVLPDGVEANGTA